MQALDSLPVPVQIRQEQEAILDVPPPRRAVDDVLHLGLAVDDVPHPLQPALVALLAHVRPHVLRVDGGRLRDDARALPAVLLEVLVRAGIDEVDLQVFMGLRGRGGRGGPQPRPRPAAGHVPEVDVVGAEVAEGAEGAGQGGEVGRRGGEGRAFEDHDAGLRADAAVEDDAAPGLICCGWVLEPAHAFCGGVVRTSLD